MRPARLSVLEALGQPCCLPLPFSSFSHIIIIAEGADLATTAVTHGLPVHGLPVNIVAQLEKGHGATQRIQENNGNIARVFPGVYVSRYSMLHTKS